MEFINKIFYVDVEEYFGYVKLLKGIFKSNDFCVFVFVFFIEIRKLCYLLDVVV